jgi:serine/threonine protein kinase
MKGLTVPYASPELIRRFRKNIGEGEAVHGWSAGDFYRADVYALGILLFEIFQGIYAWEWKTPLRI